MGNKNPQSFCNMRDCGFLIYVAKNRKDFLVHSVANSPENREFHTGDRHAKAPVYFA